MTRQRASHVEPASMRFEHDGPSQFPILQRNAQPEVRLTLRRPLECSYFLGGADDAGYTSVESLDANSYVGRLYWSREPASIHVCDEWRVMRDGGIRLKRTVDLSPGESDELEHRPTDGVQFRLRFALSGQAAGSWRFFAPAQLYSTPGEYGRGGHVRTFMEDRLACPLIMGYDPDSQMALALSRVSPATTTSTPARLSGQSRYIQRTELGSLGFSFDGARALGFHAHWPYYEGETSVALNSQLWPSSAFYPLDDTPTSLSIEYDMCFMRADNFGAAILESYSRAYTLLSPQPVRLPFAVEKSVEYRLTSLAKTYRQWEGEGAGFFFSFDPTKGYGAPPSGFGTQFNRIPSDDYNRILEYGFTGRQLNSAYVLSALRGGEWVARGKRVVDFFVRRCVHSSGWFYSLYDVRDDNPVCTLGGADPALLHYGGRSTTPGNYLRTMVESASDLLLNCQLYRSLGNAEPAWLETCKRFAQFLVDHQNPDGSWYRAYSPRGAPITGGEWFGRDEYAAKSATMIPIAFLVRLSDEIGEDSNAYLEAARKAGEYVLSHHVERDHFQGATLDNPNVVDKEAALYTLHALLALHDRLADPAVLAGAERAAIQAATWNYLWNPPFAPGSFLDRLRYQATGWGGINSIWGGGVVDIYSLFYLTDFRRVAVLTGERLYEQIAQLIAAGTQQVLSYPADLLGFADIGMQPEGIGISSQGEDDGLIAKGDIWGSLGWIYSAGIFGLDNYLHAVSSPA